MAKTQVYLQEVEEKLRAAKLKGKVSKIPDLKKYIGTSYDFIGLTVPEQREVFKKGYSWDKEKIETQFTIWDKIWSAAINYEVMTQALFFFTKNRNVLGAEIFWKYVQLWVTRIDNWAHSDSLSDLYAGLLEAETELLYPRLVEWNSSGNPWERRQSLISLLEYSRKRKKVLPVKKMLPLVEQLLKDQDVFVQKAVGWTLREIGNIYPDDCLKFLKKHVRDLSAIAFSAATEKLQAKEKELLKEMRRQRKT